MVDPHHAGIWRGSDRRRRPGRAVDHGHLAEELALAERHDDGLAGAGDLGDLDLAVEHHEQFATGRAFLKNDVIDSKLVDAFLDGHGVPPAFWLVGCTMLVGKQARANGAVGIAAGQHWDKGRKLRPRRRLVMGQNRPGSVPKISVSPSAVTISQAIKVTKWSTYPGDLNVSEQQSEPISGETGFVGAGPAAPDMSASGAPVTAQAADDIESPRLAPEQEETAPRPDAPKIEAVQAEGPTVHASQVLTAN